MFVLRLMNWDLATQTVTWSDSPLFALGATITIAVGYRNVPATTVFAGNITALEPEFASGEAPTLVVRGYDCRHRLIRGRNTRTFTEMTDSAIAGRIGMERGLSIKATATTEQHEHVYQHNQTDLEFLTERAQRIGYELTVDYAAAGLDRLLFFRPRQIDKVPRLKLSIDGDIMAFEPRLTDMGNGLKVTARATNPTEPRTPFEQLATVRSGAQGAREGDVVFIESASSSSETETIANAHADWGSPWRITGSGKCIGQPSLCAGERVDLRGFGSRFSGTYYVLSAVHTIDPAFGYVTTFSVRRDGP